MKSKFFFMMSVLLVLSFLTVGQAYAGTAFTYQGQLKDNGVVVNATCTSIAFALYDALNAGTQQGSTVTKSSVGVTDGLFTTQLDFGNQFDGNDRWLEIAVDCGSGSSTLSPRQPLTPTPYAIYAQSTGNLDAAKTTTGQFDNARINWAAPGAIGTTTQAAGAFSTLRVGTSTTGGYVLTADASGNATWNAAGTAITGSATTIDTETLTASSAMVTDGSGKVAVSSVSATELDYLDGVTGAIQTQLNSKGAGDVTLNGSQTLTNKTLNSPSVNT